MGRKVLAAKSGRVACSCAAACGGIAAKNAKDAKSLTQRHKGTEKMKPSGILWIGDIPDGWEVRRLRYLATSFRKGAGITRADVIETGDISCIRYGDIYSKYKNDVAVIKCISKTNRHLISTPQRIFKGDILFSCTGELVDEIGKNITYMGDEECLAGGDIIIVSHNQDPVFLSYALNSYVQTQKSHDKAKLKVVHISTGDIKNLLIVLPPLPVQRAIAAYLDEKCGAIDEAIVEAKKGIEEYKAWKKSLIFEVVTGKRRVGVFNAESKCARDEMHLRRSRQVTRGHRPSPVGGASGCVVGLPERSEPEGLQGAARRRVAEKMKPSGIPWIGDVPMGWEVRRLKDILARPLQYGASESGIAYDEALPRYIRITDITLDGRLKDKGVLSLTEESASDYILQDQDILLARSGATVGKAFLYEKQMGRAAFAGYLIRATVDVTNALPRFVYYTTLGCGYDDWRNSIAVSATIQNIGADKYNNYSLPMPPLTEQRAIADYLDEKCSAIDAMIAEKEALIADLEAYKKSLIYEIVTGKREVL